MTTIEVILCFVLVFIMAFSMYGTVSSYNDKRVIEKDKNEILSYKYLLTKTIQDDFVNNELSHVSIENNFEPSGKKTYILHCTLKNGTKKVLKIEQTLGYSTYNPTGLKNQSDSFMISYGTEGDLIEYPLPNLGSSTVKADPANGISEHTIQELSIQDVRIEVLEHQVLSIQIVFYHPNFGNEYGISIMAPVNYVPDINLPLTSYTLLYDDNGGSGCSDKSIHKMEDDYWGELCTPVRANHIFLGWNTKADGTGSSFTGDTKVTKNITIYAKWKKNQVHIKLNANGGSLNVTGNGYTIDADGSIKYNDTYNMHTIDYGSSLDGNGLLNWNNSSYLSLKKDGYSIDSDKVWNTAANGMGANFDQTTAYSANNFCDASSSDCTITLYANWKPNTFTVAYNANGGSGSTTSHNCTYDADCYLKASGFSKSGYKFVGWKKSDSGTTLAAGTSIKNAATSGTVTYWAQWEVDCDSSKPYWNGTNCYKNLKAALDGTSANGTIQLMYDTTDSSTPVSKKSGMKLVLNGHTLTKTSQPIKIGSGALTITNGTITSGLNTNLKLSAGTLTIDGTSSNVTIKNTKSMSNQTSAQVVLLEKGTFNFKGDNAKIISGANGRGYARGVKVNEKATFNMSGGSIEVTATTSYGPVGVNVHGKFNMTGGSITAKKVNSESYGVGANKNGKVNITGGKVTITGRDSNTGLGAVVNTEDADNSCVFIGKKAKISCTNSHYCIIGQNTTIRIQSGTNITTSNVGKSKDNTTTSSTKCS